ncbi:MAG: dipeptidase PepV [Fusobacteriaceae bacterium]
MSINTKQYHEELIKSIIENIQIPSVEGTPEPGMPFGSGPAKALENALALGKKLGFNATNLDNYVGFVEVGEGTDIVGILGHVDVVPEAEGWDFPPYSGTIHEGYLYGRGVSDDKGPIITAMYALKALVDSGVKLNKRVRIILGANEETGFGCMTHYVKHAEPVTVGFTPDASFPGIHGEKGILQLQLSSNTIKETGSSKIISLKGGAARNSVADRVTVKIENGNLEEVKKCMETTFKENSIKYVSTLENGILSIEVHGKSAHGAYPHLGINAISHLMNALYNAKVSPELTEFYMENIGLAIDGSNWGVDLTDNYGILTMNIGIIEYTPRDFKMSIDIRYPISKVLDEVMTLLNKKIDDSKFKLDILAHKDPIYFEIDSPLITALSKAYQKVTGDTQSKPETTGGGTYARAMKNVVAFGGTFPGFEENPHQPNEKVLVENIYKQLDIYVEAILNLLAL